MRRGSLKVGVVSVFEKLKQIFSKPDGGKPMLQLVKPEERTKREEALANVEAVRETLAKMEQAQSKIEEELEEAILAGESTEDLEKQWKAITEAIAQAIKRIEVYGKAAQAALPDHIRQQIAELEEERRRLHVEGAQAEDEYLPLKEQFYRTRALYESGANERGHKIEAIAKKIYALQAELAQLEGPSEPEEQPESPYTVEEWLELLRAGEVRTYISGTDQNLDEAYKQYEEEIQAIRDYGRARRLKIATAEPDCIDYWPRNRVRDLMKRK